MLIIAILWKTRLVVLAAIFIQRVVHLVTTVHYERQTFSEEIQIYSTYGVIFTTVRPSDLSCAWFCHKQDGCVSFFYNKDSKTCIGSKNPCQVSPDQEEDNSDKYACWTVGASEPSEPSDCQDVLSRNQSAEDGVYSIKTGAGTKLDVYCIMSEREGGWTVFMRRYNGEVLFNRTFQEYDEGFGDKAGEHWLGLRYIYEMTATVPTDLYISSFGGLFPGSEREAFEEWSDFSIGPGPNYTLHVGALTNMTYHNEDIESKLINESNGKTFTSWDVPMTTCEGVEFCSHGDGGFWHLCCMDINPTGIYHQQPTFSQDAMYNFQFHGILSLKAMTLMYRRSAVKQDVFNKVVR